MNETQISERWRKASLDYVTALNAWVARGLAEGWTKNIGPEPKDDRDQLAEEVLNVVRRANRIGQTDTLREMFPPAWSPFLPVIEQKGQSLAPMMWIDDERIALHIGATYEKGPILVADDEGVLEYPAVLGFGKSPDGTLFALAFDESIQVRRDWEGPALAIFPWPSGEEGLPPGYGAKCEIQKSKVTQIAVFPDGQRVLAAFAGGVFVLSKAGATRLLPQMEQATEYFDWHRREYPTDLPTLNISMEHGAISPQGDFVLAGCQDSKHIVFDRDLKKIAEIGPFSEYPHYAWFTADGEVAAFNSCHFYNGASIAVPVQDLNGLNTEYYEDHSSVRVLDREARVYAAVALDDEFIVGDAYGYLRAFDLNGNFRWRHFIGSTINALDLSPDRRKLAVTSFAGFLCVLQLYAGERDPFAIGTATHRELRRWIFWKGEEGPLRW